MLLDAGGYLVDPRTGSVPERGERVRALARANFVDTINEALADRALDQIGGGAGSELKSAKSGVPPKFLAAYSSAALAANVFAPLIGRGDSVELVDGAAIADVTLEKRLKIGYGCGTPNLDVVGSTPAGVVAIESKCTEQLSRRTTAGSSAFASVAARRAKLAAERKQPALADPYGDAIRALGDHSATALYRALLDDPLRYRYLDATQLLKHYLGLRAIAGRQPRALVYLYWRPLNWQSVEACVAHDEELRQFRCELTDKRVPFADAPYDVLWAHWREGGDPGLSKHAAALEKRYRVTVP